MILELTQPRLQTPSYYYREFKNDLGFKKEANQSTLYQRIALISLPFLSLYKPLSDSISLTVGIGRMTTNFSQLYVLTQTETQQADHYQLLQTVISVIALAGTIFAHPAGMLITTGQDMLIDCSHLIHELSKQNYTEALKRSVSIVNNALYLGLFYTGSLELLIASLSVQISLGLYHSLDEYLKGNHPEALGYLAMALIRSNQMVGHARALQEKWKLEEMKRSMEDTGLVEASQNGCSLNISSYKSGTTIFAQTTQYAFYNGSSAFIASYSEGNVVTILQDPSGNFKPATQVILHGNTPISMSTNFKIDAATSCMTHEHDSFTVYTIGESQRVLIK